MFREERLGDNAYLLTSSSIFLHRLQRWNVGSWARNQCSVEKHLQAPIQSVQPFPRLDSLAVPGAYTLISSIDDVVSVGRSLKHSRNPVSPDSQSDK